MTVYTGTGMALSLCIVEGYRFHGSGCLVVAVARLGGNAGNGVYTQKTT